MAELKQALYSSRLSAITGLEVYAYEDAPRPTLVGFLDGKPVVAAQRMDWKETEKWFLVFNLGRVRALLLEQQQGRCARCGATRPLQLHHKVYRSEHRDDRPENCEMCCSACHDAEHGPTLALAKHAAERTDDVSPALVPAESSASGRLQ